jgi:hypothetical protein
MSMKPHMSKKNKWEKIKYEKIHSKLEIKS